VKSFLSLSHEQTFSLVLEEDGSTVPLDVISSVIEDKEMISTLMVLQPGQLRTPAGLFVFMVTWLMASLLLVNPVNLTNESTQY